jgi:hypothetical protein
MKRSVAWIFAILLVLISGGYIFYKYYFTDLVAEAIVSEDLPGFLPMRIRNKIKEAGAPLNEGASTFIKDMHTHDITIDQVLEALDNTTEDQAYALLDELDHTKLQSTDQVFDIAKKHFPVDFDPEAFRSLFNSRTDLKHIRKAMKYAKVNRQSKDIDLETGKAIIRKILLEKEKEFLGEVNAQH